MEQLALGFKGACKKGITSGTGQEICKVYYLEQSDWEAIRVEFLTRNSMNFKTHMRNQIFELNNKSLTTVQPPDVNLYSSNQTNHLITDSIVEIVKAYR